MLNKYSNSSKILSLILLIAACLSTSAISAQVLPTNFAIKNNINTNGLPAVFNENHGNLVESKLRQEAAFKFPLHQLPQTKEALEAYRIDLRNKIIKKTGVLVNQKLPLNMKETKALKMQGYSIRNISFQTRPGAYATANLYIPDGAGKFPGVIVMMGHSANGRFYDKYQAVGITLAQQGYVSLCIDPWGAGERTTTHGVFEDHGDENNLGAAFMNVGETLMGMILTDNIRGVDLLTSLPYVDPRNIGATGSSGGGNQTMWLAAIDERVKAAVPVVSVGTFESYVMGTPCICEVLPDGLTFSEEAGVLALMAPRAIKMCNHYKDANQAFYPKEMLRTYLNAKRVYEMLGAEKNIAYQTFDLPHGYFPEDRKIMVGWFDLHLKQKGTGAPVEEDSSNVLPYEQLMTFTNGKRDANVVTTAEYCKQRGSQLKNRLFRSTVFDAALKRNELRRILRADEKTAIRKVHEYATIDGWQRVALETTDDKLIPVLFRPPSVKSREVLFLVDPAGKENISSELISKLVVTGAGIAIVDLSGTGETSSPALYSTDTMGRLRTLSKSLLWLGKTVMGEWVKELDLVTTFISSRHRNARISFNGNKEAGLAGLYLAALGSSIQNITLLNAPVSYVFDDRHSIEFFSTGIHIPGFLNWGDVSLAAALTGKNVKFINPVTMSGEKCSTEGVTTFSKEFEQMRKISGQVGKSVFK